MKFKISENIIHLNFRRYYLIEMIKQKIIKSKNLSSCLSKKRVRDIINGNEILFDYVIEQFEFVDDRYKIIAKDMEKEYQEAIKKLLTIANIQIEKIKNIKK